MTVKGGETPRPTENKVFRLLAGHILDNIIRIPIYTFRNKNLMLLCLLALAGIEYDPKELNDKYDVQVRELSSKLDNRGRGMGWKIEGLEPRLKKTRDPERIAHEMNRHGTLGFTVTPTMVLDAQTYRITGKLPRELSAA